MDDASGVGQPRTMDPLESAAARASSQGGMVDYHVDTPEGAVGILEGWRHDRSGRPLALVVGQGWLGRRRVEIPPELVRSVDHEGRRIVVAIGAAPLESRSRLTRWVERLRGRASRDAWPSGRAPGRRVNNRKR